MPLPCGKDEQCLNMGHKSTSHHKTSNPHGNLAFLHFHRMANRCDTHNSPHIGPHLSALGCRSSIRYLRNELCAGIFIELR
jgi:hypothetical protein